MLEDEREMQRVTDLEYDNVVFSGKDRHKVVIELLLHKN